MLREPRVDDHLVEPEVTRDEVIGGVRVVALPVELPHATQQSRLNYVVRAHVIPGYRLALELLTRFNQESDFVTDVCVFQGRPRPGNGPSLPGGDRL